jgi:hypothetical protein
VDTGHLNSMLLLFVAAVRVRTGWNNIR